MELIVTRSGQSVSGGGKPIVDEFVKQYIARENMRGWFFVTVFWLLVIIEIEICYIFIIRYDVNNFYTDIHAVLISLGIFSIIILLFGTIIIAYRAIHCFSNVFSPYIGIYEMLNSKK